MIDDLLHRLQNLNQDDLTWLVGRVLGKKRNFNWCSKRDILEELNTKELEGLSIHLHAHYSL